MPRPPHWSQDLVRKGSRHGMVPLPAQAGHFRAQRTGEDGASHPGFAGHRGAASEAGRSTMGRPELEKAIAVLGTGDVLVLPESDRATRSMLDGIQIIQRVAARGALAQD